jgi:hypothetical protein
MTTEVVRKLNQNVPGKYEALFGPPPLYKVEDEKNYNANLCALEQDVNPRDHVERIYVRDLADHVYEIQWWRRFRSRLIKQLQKEELRRQANEIAHAALIRKQGLRGSDFGSFYTSKNASNSKERDPEAEAALNAESQKIDAETESALAELRQAEHGPIDEAALFRNWIPLYDLVEKRLTVAEEKLSITLAQLEEHRNGLGPLLRRATETIIDAEPIDDLAPAREALAAPEEPRQPQ